AVAAVAPTAGQSTYTPVAPVRLLDTRTDGGRLGAQQTRDLQVTGRAGVPTTASAVALSVTLVGVTATTDLKVYPTPVEPGSSSLVVVAGVPASNLVVTAVGDGGQVRLKNATGSVQVVVDLAGYYAEGAGSTFVPAPPRRLLDTRTTRTPVGPAETRVLTVAGGSTGAPADATAVAVNLTAVDATAPTTDVRAYPTGPGGPPNASNANPGKGHGTATAAVVPVGQGGAISLYNSAGRVSLIVDLQGWYVPSTTEATASVFHPLPPRRLLDTRSDGPAVAGGATRDVVVAGARSPETGGQDRTVPAQATGVALVVTAVDASAVTDVRVYPLPSDGSSFPGSSNLNTGPGGRSANTVLSAVGRDGSVRLRNSAGTVSLVVDLVGWYGPAGTGFDVSWPQCTSAGATTATTPSGGGFAMVGVTRGRPFTDNECLAAEWSWASSLPGEPAAYLNLDAPGSDSPQWTAPGAEPCSGASTDSACARNYGRAVAAYAVARTPATPSGGRPFVWLDVELGPTWQTGAGAVAVNRGVVNGAAEGLRAAGYTRYGIYTDAEAAASKNDWKLIMGEFALPQLPLWVFASSNSGTRELCVPAPASTTHGPVQVAQLHPSQSGSAFDVDDLC
ncbi:MAG: N-acetylmuramoyl-L-alanine amidase family 2, partial [Frankiales bacterium]|nr:N-acetylmuramoyl-L-alanine amidase family 2 [Frankiales bacterium]